MNVNENEEDKGAALAPIAPPPGRISPFNCKVSGGVGNTLLNGTVGVPMMVILTAFDANDRRIYEGGARVKLKASNKENTLRIDGTVRDNR